MEELDDLDAAVVAAPRRRSVPGWLMVAGVAVAALVAVDVMIADPAAQPDAEAYGQPDGDTDTSPTPEITTTNPVVIQVNPMPGESCAAGTGSPPSVDHGAAADADTPDEAPRQPDRFGGGNRHLFLDHDELICVMYLPG